MKKSITIRIPEPCHEDWQKMTQTEKGKFCSICTKEVIDFTSKTDEDIVTILSNSKNTCGKFKKTQLNREVKLERKPGLNLAPYAASLLLPLSLLNTTHASSSDSSIPEKPHSSLSIGRFSKSNRAIINTTGKITDTSGKGLSNVIIRASESNKNVKSDINGTYSITTMDGETLSFESDGFLNHNIELGSRSSEKNISMISEVIESMIMGGLTDIYIVEEVEEIEVMGDMIEVSEEINSDAVIIHGTVRDEDGLTLPGANIIIEGTNIGTQSDFDGNYSLEVEANQTLQFSYVGYTPKSISVSNISNYINVNLELSAEFMGEVIITGIVGYGNYEPVVPPPNAAEIDAAGKARKLSYKNGKEYKRLQHEREKADRKLKRSQRK
ncbi:MAG: hypothetical protein ACI83B_001998 [Sediminicola sp.]|jgi:hypothetical protein|tara:strand:+ start:3035 stop:4183 length:1149 start_codon:yes stop_codon:yes gene_type:complete